MWDRTDNYQGGGMMTEVKRDSRNREVRHQIERLIDEAIQANVRETTRLASRTLVTVSDLLVMAAVFGVAFLSVALLRA